MCPVREERVATLFHVHAKHHLAARAARVPAGECQVGVPGSAGGGPDRQAAVVVAAVLVGEVAGLHGDLRIRDERRVVRGNRDGELVGGRWLVMNRPPELMQKAVPVPPPATTSAVARLPRSNWGRVRSAHLSATSVAKMDSARNTGTRARRTGPRRNGGRTVRTRRRFTVFRFWPPDPLGRGVPPREVQPDRLRVAMGDPFARRVADSSPLPYCSNMLIWSPMAILGASHRCPKIA